jgi:hypothetical protein
VLRFNSDQADRETYLGEEPSRVEFVRKSTLFFEGCFFYAESPCSGCR